MATGTAPHKLDVLISNELQRQRAAQPQSQPMQRCEHGVYIPAWAHKSGKAPYCSGCNPSAKIPNVRNVILPRNSHLDADTPRANAKSEGRCNECSSNIYEEISDKERRCADCGALYSVRRARRTKKDDDGEFDAIF